MIHYMIEFNVCQKMIQFNIGFNIARVGQSVESALIALAAIFWLMACILTIVDKKYRILTRRDKRGS